MSATIQLSEMESKSRVCETEVRDKGQGLKCRQGEYQVKKDNRNIWESMRENEKQANDPVGSEANPIGQKWVEPSEVETRLLKVMENQGTNIDISVLTGGAVCNQGAETWLAVRAHRVG